MLTTKAAPFTEQSPGPGRRSWRNALGLCLWLRVTYSAVAASFALTQSPDWERVHANALTESLTPPSHSLSYLLVGIWERFDTLWYLHIAANGYDRPEAVVFFPLFPVLIKIVSFIIPPMGAALLVSTSAAFFLFWGLQELLIGDHPTTLAGQSVLFCALWPASFIFFAGYPESLLFALIVWSLFWARRGRWAAAAALALTASLTKAVGVVVIIPLLVVAIRQRRMNAWPIFLVPLGTIGFLGYVQHTRHITLNQAYVHYWHTMMVPPWTTLWASLHALVHTPDSVLIMNLVLLLLAAVLTARSHVKIEYLLYAAAAMGVFLCKETTFLHLQSMSRYLLILFPMYVGFAGLMQRPWLQRRFTIVCAALLSVNLGLLWLYLRWLLVV